MDLALAEWRARAADRSVRIARPHRLPPGAVRALGPMDDGWPSVLDGLGTPPAALFVRGRSEPLPPPHRCLAIIGARRCTAEGRTIARALGAAAARAGLVVVSGLALGIDAAAQAGAVDEGGLTLGVLASAVDDPTPRANARLARRIADGGGWLVSERPPGARVHAHSFPWRNRIVAALASALVVVEAGLPSGTLGTVEWALRLGRRVGAVPGSVLSPASAGSNALLTRGAVPITCADDAVGLVSLVRAPEPVRSPEEEAVWRAVPGASAPVAQWVEGAELDPPAARAALLGLIARGQLVRHGALVLRSRL